MTEGARCSKRMEENPQESVAACMHIVFSVLIRLSVYTGSLVVLSSTGPVMNSVFPRMTRV